MTIEFDEYKLAKTGRFNIILGKNGCGKSYVLRKLEEGLRRSPDYRVVKYLSPERGGVIAYEPNIEQLLQDPDVVADTRRRNQAGQFRQQSIAQLRRLEMLFLRELQDSQTMRRDKSIHFNTVLDKINSLLDRVEIRCCNDIPFRVYVKERNQPANPDELSSGEAELISLAVECLIFEIECENIGRNLLLIDEPDVHLHPDLLERFALFISKLKPKGESQIIVATHSTVFLSALSRHVDTRICFMKYGVTTFGFEKVSEVHQRILPVFGAHPLSSVFNAIPILIVEGEDEERVWQKAVRSSQHKIEVYPCPVDGISRMNIFEKEVDRIIRSVYDNARAYSVRDGDGKGQALDDVGVVKRMRLACRSLENLLLTDEVLAARGFTWEQFKNEINTWLANNDNHPHFSYVAEFAEQGFDRRHADLKEIRNDLASMLGTNLDWEILVGSEIAKIPSRSPASSEFSLECALGTRIVELILRPSPHH